MRKTNFVNGEYYHIYNRGVDKRDVFLNKDNLDRFLKSILEFNSVKPIGSLYKLALKQKNPLLSVPNAQLEKLVEIIGYCLNPNHYHLILKQISENGISKFMQKIGQGYAMYFNEQHERNGALFQGRFKAIHINSNEYLLHLSAYVNLNDRVHQLSVPNAQSSQLSVRDAQSSWDEYVYNKKGLCDKDIILGQFSSIEQYKNFAEKSLQDIIERRDIEKMLLE